MLLSPTDIAAAPTSAAGASGAVEVSAGTTVVEDVAGILVEINGNDFLTTVVLVEPEPPPPVEVDPLAATVVAGEVVWLEATVVVVVDVVEVVVDVVVVTGTTT